MADDRIYMQCNICGEKLYLGKQFGWGAFFWENYHNKSLEDSLNEFFEKHVHPCENKCKWNGNYSIVYEIDHNEPFDEAWMPYIFEEDEECEGCEGTVVCEKYRKKAIDTSTDPVQE